MDLRGFGLSEDDLRQLGYDVKRAPGGAGSGSPSGGRGPGPKGGAPSSQGPRRWAPATRTWLTTLVVLGAVAWASSSSRWLPAPLPTAAPDTAFSSGRAMAQLVDIAQRARPTGSPENERVRDHLVARLSSLGLDVEVRPSTEFVREGQLVRAATVRNVIARVPGAASSGSIALTAHYDSAPLSPGAADDGIGVATILEVVRALLAGTPLRNDVLIVLTDGDELGGLGARAFARADPPNDLAVVLSIEARGPTGPAIVFETGADNGGLVEALAAVEPRPTAQSLARRLRSRAVESSGDDASSPGPLGAAVGLTLATLGDAALGHQAFDTRDRVSEATLQHGGRQVLAMTRALGALDLETELAGADRVYLSLPRVGLAHYPRSWVLPTTLALLVFWGLAALVLRGRRATVRGVGLGIAVGGLTVAAAATMGRAVRELTAEFHPEAGALWTAYYADGPHVLAIVALTVAVGAVLAALGRRWARGDEMIFGALSVPLVYAVWLTFAEPFTAPALQLPLATALLGGALVIFLGPRRAGSVWTWAALLLITALALTLIVPSVELLAAAWTLHSATSIGAVVGLGSLLLWPIMDRLLLPRWWWTPTAGLLAAAALLATTLPMTRNAIEHPTPTTLVYLADEPVSASAPSRVPGAEADTSRTRSMAGKWLTIPGPGEEWARSWAGEPAQGSTEPGVLLIGPADARYEIIGTAPVTELAPPSVSVSAVALDGTGKVVTLAIEPGLAGELTGVHLLEGSPGELIGIESARWGPGAGPVRSLVHWGAPSGGALHVGVRVASETPAISLQILEHHLRPREVVGTYFFQRPDSMVARADVGSDRAIQRTSVRVSLDARP